MRSPTGWNLASHMLATRDQESLTSRREASVLFRKLEGEAAAEDEEVLTAGG